MTEIDIVREVGVEALRSLAARLTGTAVVSARHDRFDVRHPQAVP
jgi:hypothetical protein